MYVLSTLSTLYTAQDNSFLLSEAQESQRLDMDAGKSPKKAQD